MEERTNSPAARLYRSMYLIRRVEEEIIRLYPTDKIKSPVHLSIGQEAVSAAVCDHLDKSDVVFGTYRGHALYLAKGGDVPRMMAELYGKVDGCARGKAGSMHLVDPVGQHDGHLGGGGDRHLQRGRRRAGAQDAEVEGDRRLLLRRGRDRRGRLAREHELRLAQEAADPVRLREQLLRDLQPCEAIAWPALACGARSRAYGIEAELIEDHEPMKLHERAGAAVAAVRRGEGPRFLECMTYRWRDHVGPTEDRVHKYRPDAELDAKIEGDNLKIVGDLLPADLRKSIEAAEEKRVADAIAFAEASTFPEDQEIYDHVFAG